MELTNSRQAEHINKNQNNYLCSLPCLLPLHQSYLPHLVTLSVLQWRLPQSAKLRHVPRSCVRCTAPLDSSSAIFSAPHCFHRLQTFSSPSLPQFYLLPPLVFPMSQPFGSHSNLSPIFLRNCSESNWFIFIFSFIFPHIHVWIFFFVDLVRWMGKLKYIVVCDDLVRKYCEQNRCNSINKRFEGLTYSTFWTTKFIYTCIYKHICLFKYYITARVLQHHWNASKIKLFVLRFKRNT